MNLRALLLLSALLPALPLSAQTEDAPPPQCAESLKTPLPAEATIIPAPSAWPECDSYKSYSGIGRKVDYSAAGHCAWRERLAQDAGLEPRYTVSSVFGGSAMLTVLYANGEGVKRDISLALRFACESGGAPAEIKYRMKSLLALQSASPAPDSKFDFCQDITSGFMMGFCAAYSSEIAEQKRTSAIDALTSGWPVGHRTAFARVLAAVKVYAEAHGRGEIDLSGTARAMSQIDAEDSLLDDFRAAIESFEKGDLPRAGHDDAGEADRRLNEVYRNTLADADKHKSDYGAVQPEGIRTAERAWLRYRDAFIYFARVHYPSVASDAWLALLARDRISVIDGSFCDMDAVEGPCAEAGDTWKPSPLP
jgi:uncharacterized protein YecT (DUF1311 family)